MDYQSAILDATTCTRILRPVAHQDHIHRPMNNDCFFRIAAEQHVGYIKGAVQARAQRIKNGTLTLRDRVRRLANRSGAYLVGSSALGCYKFGYGASLRIGI